MSASLAVFRFELGYHLRRPGFWVVALLFAALGAVDMVSNGTRGNAFFYVNSPSQVLQQTIWYTLFSVLAATAFVAEAFVRDRRCGMEPLVMATPVRRRDLVGIRFAGALAAAVLAFSGYLPGMVLGSLAPGLSPFAIGPMRWDGFLLGWLLFALPNLIFVCVFAFVLASRSRSIVAAYAGAVLLVMLYVSAMLMVGVEAVDHRQLQWWSLFDPYGYFALQSVTLQWTVHQHNTLLPPLDGVVAANRALWLTVSLIVWLLAYWRFDMRPMAATGSGRKKRKAGKPAAHEGATPAIAATAFATPQQPPGWAALPSLAWFELKLILSSRIFQGLLFCGLVSLFFAASGSRSFEHAQPSTDILVHAAGLYFRYVMLAIVVFYAAELSWRGRDLRLQPVIDATPLPAWLLVLPKLLALVAVIALQLLLCMVVLAAYQALHGYYRFELGLSAQMLFGVQGPYYVFVAVLALFCQAVLRHRYAGIAVTVLVAGSVTVLDALGKYHNLYRFGATNDIAWSPMNGWAGLFEGHLWFTAYWAAVCVLLLAATCAFWPRGEGPALRRPRRAWRDAGGGVRWSAGLGAAGAAVLGGWIVYNTTVLNSFQPPGKELLAVEHERRFKQFEQLPMPVVVGTQLKVDLYPRQRWFVAQGQYTLENRSGQPIQELHLSTFLGLKLVDVKAAGARLAEAHPEWGYYIYRLATPLPPGAQTTLSFVTRTDAPKGFQNHVDSDDVYMVAPNEVLANGSSLYAPFILPFIGYTKMVEHKEAWLRHKYGLPPLDQRMRPHDDATGLARALTTSHVAWGPTDMVVGTDDDQTAVGSGNELRRWHEGDRNYVHYRSQPPERGKFTLYSAHYQRSDAAGARVPVEVYHHPPHADNAAVMGRHLAQALTLYEKLFGPYPFRQLRLAEFAYYPGMVFSEAGTIGLPEVIAWKSDLRPGSDGEDAMVGWLGYLLGHSWWDDALITADVAGSMSVREALSGYASNLYRRSIYPPERWQRVKQQQMREFFRAIGRVDFEQPPLTEVYNEVLVARYKGQMVLEQIESLIGQPALLTAIHRFGDRFAGQPPPYATVLDLRDAILAETPAEWRDRVRELFHHIVSYRFGVQSAERQVLPSGAWQARITVQADKLLDSGLGRQQEAAFDMPLQLRVLDAKGQTLLSRRLQLSAPRQRFDFELPARPARVQLDPAYDLPSAVLPQRNRGFSDGG